MLEDILSALRSLVFMLWLTVTVVPWALAVLLVSIFVRGDRVYWLCVGWLRLAIWGAKAFCGVRARVQGLENLPSTGETNASVILLSKHQSIWETFAFPCLMRRPLAYVFKRELLFVPFFGWAMSRLDMIHIDRSKRVEAWARVAEQGANLMRHGHWIIMFPEGTRIARGQRGQYKPGGARLAVTTGRSVVPIAVTSARCWPRKSFLLRPGVVDVCVGPPIDPVGETPQELMRKVEMWIETQMQRLDPQAYPSVGPASP